MYGTVARMRVKPGKRDELRRMTENEDTSGIPGHVNTLVYQMDADPNKLILVILFESKDAYVKNADSPGQDARYREWVALLEDAPEWNDGEVIYQMK